MAREGRDLDLGSLIRMIQSPPFDKIGVMDLESIFPSKDRFSLTMTLNNLLASPGFAAWMEGDPLDVQKLLYNPAGRPRLSIISIAHLTDAERMFFVTILLNEVVTWMRSQPGTSSLRALLYMDEVFGYFPPTANPPAKTPMLTLLKQARAYGVGVVLATQNPVDLDYKGLSNAGTWFIGRLQTERDKARVLDGLEGASAAAGATLDRQKMDQVLSGLGKRVFLMNNVHEDQPVVFQSRWALSYLCGPLSREQIQTLMAGRKAAAKPQAATAAASTLHVSSARPANDIESPAPRENDAGASTQRPLLPPGIPEFFVPCRKSAGTAKPLNYRPALLGTARVHFAQSKSNIDVWESLTVLAPLDETLPSNIWEGAQRSKDDDLDLEKAPAAGGWTFAALPSELSKPKKIAELTNSLKDSLYRTQTLEIWKSRVAETDFATGRSGGDFRVRLSQAARQDRDQKIEKLRARYAPKVALLQDRLRRAQQKVEKEKSQASQQTFQTVLSVGSSLLGALVGRKIASVGNVSRAASAARAAGRIGRENQDVALATENVEALESQVAELDVQFRAESDSLQDSVSPDRLSLEEVVIKPKKADISVTRVGLVWLPFAVGADGVLEPLH